MKSNKYQRRLYRDWINAKGLYVSRLLERETDLEILTDKPVDQNFLRERVRLYRKQIEDYISKDRKFFTALKPMAVESKAAPIIKKMAEAAKKAGVGPMAAVAGVIAEFLGGDLLKRGCREVIVENGGDVFLKIRKIRQVQIYAGKKNKYHNLRLKIRPLQTPLGICASSGRIGHSLSFGQADAAVIFSKSAALADAAATAVANRVNSAEDLEKAADFSKSIKGITGALVIYKGRLACWGKLELIA